MILARILVAFLFIIPISGYSSSLDKMTKAFAEDNPAEFEAVMDSFIAKARSSDLDGMVALTSNVTIKMFGLEKLKEFYSKDTMPAIKTCKTFSKGMNITHVTKKQTKTGPGWVYIRPCTLENGETFLMRFVILKEDGRIALTTTGPGA